MELTHIYVHHVVPGQIKMTSFSNHQLIRLFRLKFLAHLFWCVLSTVLHHNSQRLHLINHPPDHPLPPHSPTSKSNSLSPPLPPSDSTTDKHDTDHKQNGVLNSCFSILVKIFAIKKDFLWDTGASVSVSPIALAR